MKWALAALSPFYYGLQSVRNQMYDKAILETVEVSVPVVSVGNLSFGGTGKTPFVRWLCTRELLRDLKIAVICRPYKSAYKGDVQKLDSSMSAMPEMYGDEACMLASSLKKGSVFVGNSKSDAAKFIDQQGGFDLIIVDDGFQHRRLKRDVDIVLIDDSVAAEQYQAFPKGNLREPIAAITRANWAIFTKSKDVKPERKALFSSQIESSLGDSNCLSMGSQLGAPTRVTSAGALEMIDIKPEEFVVVTGVGNPGQVFTSYQEKFGKNLGTMDFDDHHQFSEFDIYKILDFQKRKKAKYILCTEKDYIKIKNKMKNSSDLYFVPQDFFCYENEAGLVEEIRALHT